MRRVRFWFGVAAMSAIVHVATVLAVPRLIMLRVIERVSSAGQVTPYHAPRPTPAMRAIPLPSPDLLYSLCIVDVTDGDVAVRAKGRGDYLSVSVFDSRSDNVFVMNDQSTGASEIRLLISTHESMAGMPAGFQRVLLPGGRGVLLLRTLAATPDMSERAEQARRTLRCDKLQHTAPS